MTGGGYIDDSGKTSFGFTVRSDGTGGKIECTLQAGASRFKAESLVSLFISGNTATFVTVGEWNGISGYRLTVTVVDVGAPKKGARDTISVVIEAPNGSIAFSTSGPLAGGNIVIH